MPVQISELVQSALVGLVVGTIIGTPILLSGVAKIGRMKLHRMALPLVGHQKQYDLAMRHDQWAQAQGFTLIGFLRLGIKSRNLMCAWKAEGSGRYCCVYYMTLYGIELAPLTEFTTVFGHMAVLKTGGGWTRHLAPSPCGYFIQTFARKTLDEQYRLHLDAEAYLERNHHQRVTRHDIPIEEITETIARRKSSHLQSIPLWYFKLYYWVLTRWARFGNKSIEQQHCNGLIRLDEPTIEDESQ